MEKITPRVSRAIDTFLDAINNGTLVKGTCVACAVGNLVAKGMGATIEVKKYGRHTMVSCDKDVHSWNIFFQTSNGKQSGPACNFIKASYDYVKQGELCVNSTEFTKEELAKIEFTFETNTKIRYDDYHLYADKTIKNDQIKGLSAVIEVMKTFDDCNFSIKERFVDKVLV